MSMLKTLLVFVCGALIGGLAVWKLPALGQTAGKDPADPTKADAAKIDLTALNNDVARLKSIVPSNSHIMEDVSFHYSNSGLPDRRRTGHWRCFISTKPGTISVG
jgi:hypothetical protein